MAQVHIEEYGCSASRADSEMIAGMLAERGHTIARGGREADVSVIVTCSVKDATANRMMHRMRRLSKGPLVVAGCMAKAEPETVGRIVPSASVIGPEAISRIGEAVDAAIGGRRVVILDGADEKVGLPRVRLNPAVGIVEIASGCMSECSFCQTKLAKGAIQSYRVGDIVRQVRADIGDGCSEIWLTSTDNGCYGHDIGSSLPELLGAVSGIEGDFGIRVGMMNPMYMGRIFEGLVGAIARDRRIYRFLHIPVQSGSDAVLADMRRGHTRETFAAACRRIREKFGRFTIATDIIVGYPTEGEGDFERTVRMLEETRPDVINLSRYSSRPGTEAGALERLDEAETRRRSRTIHELAERISREGTEKWIGWRGPVRLVERNECGLAGRNYAYRQISLDGPAGANLGQTVEVEVTGASAHGLIGRPLAKKL